MTSSFVVAFLVALVIVPPVLWLLARGMSQACPFCASRVPNTASVCSHCGRALRPPLS